MVAGRDGGGGPMSVIIFIGHFKTPNELKHITKLDFIMFELQRCDPWESLSNGSL